MISGMKSPFMPYGKFWDFHFLMSASSQLMVITISVAELNFDIMCGCMPVVFVMFKGVTQNTLKWESKLRSWTARSKSDIEMQPYTEVENGSLPQVPRGTLGGGGVVKIIHTKCPPLKAYGYAIDVDTAFPRGGPYVRERRL